VVVFENPSDALALLLPPPIQYSYTRSYMSGASFTAEEVAYVARIHHNRRLEFATGRHCALAALSALNYEAILLGREPDGRPRWPPGFLGSISHCERLCVAAVVREPMFAALGLDVELRAPLPEGVLELVASPEEIAALPCDTFPALGRPPFDTVLFSGKESVFKALYPEVRRFFGFEEVSLALSVDGRFEAQLQPRLASEVGRQSLSGQFALTRDYVLTAVVVQGAEATDRQHQALLGMEL
jgi:4'-phosphopantetheinyl transferase EntD